MKERRKLVIKKMPDRETLEEFVGGMCGKPTVIFDAEKGEFVQKDDRPINTNTSKK